MICSVLIPTRARKDRLVRCIRSIRGSCSKPGNIEIILRIDDDDQQMMGSRLEMEIENNCTVLVGKRGLGWQNSARMCDEMIAVQKGTWCWFMNDDAVVEGNGWDTQLETIATNGFVVHPEVYGLGPSRYRNCGGGPFPIVPSMCWKRYGWDKLIHPVDDALNQLLIHEHRWKYYFLKGITFLHERDDDGQIALHRQGV